MKDAAHCLMRAISTAKGKVKLWYDALDDLLFTAGKQGFYAVLLLLYTVSIHFLI